MGTRSGAVYGPEWEARTVNSRGDLSFAGSLPANTIGRPLPNTDYREFLAPIPSSAPQTQPRYAEATLSVWDNRFNAEGGPVPPSPTLQVLVFTNNDGYLPVNVPITLNGAPLVGNACFDVPGQLDAQTVNDLNQQVNALWAAAGQTRPY